MPYVSFPVQIADRIALLWAIPVGKKTDKIGGHPCFLPAQPALGDSGFGFSSRFPRQTAPSQSGTNPNITPMLAILDDISFAYFILSSQEILTGRPDPKPARCEEGDITY